MVTIEEKALQYAKQTNGNFIIKTISASGGCCEMPIRSLVIEILKDFKSTNNYLSYEYEGIKIFIEKGLQLGDEILVYRKLKLPLVGNIFGVKGVSIKYI